MNKRLIYQIIKIVYIIFILIIFYQVMRAILGGTWATENIIIGAIAIIISGMFAILIALINQSGKIGKLQGKIDEHLRKHK